MQFGKVFFIAWLDLCFVAHTIEMFERSRDSVSSGVVMKLDDFLFGFLRFLSEKLMLYVMRIITLKFPSKAFSNQTEPLARMTL